jgi:outer membrane protein OmpA-like peptidoglycan-associated protein
LVASRGVALFDAPHGKFIAGAEPPINSSSVVEPFQAYFQEYQQPVSRDQRASSAKPSTHKVCSKEMRSMNSVKKNMSISGINVTSGLFGSLVFVALCVSLAGCAAQHPAAATQPDANHGAPAASTATVPPAPAPQQATPPSPAALTAQQQPAVPPVVTPPAPPPPPPVLGFDEAVAKAARAVFAAAPPPGPNAGAVVIDPLVDGMSGFQSKATQTIQEHIVRIVKDDFPQYTVHGISPESLKQGPRVLVGTFTPVNAEMKTTGVREAYRFCLVMGDLGTGKVIAKSVTRARIADVDATPTSIFRDSPVWTVDPSIQAYINTCQASKVGDPIKAEYLDGLLASALVSEAGDAYDHGHYAEALDLFTTARKTPAGDQLRVYNGRYEALAKLGRDQQEQVSAFHDLVDYGIRRNQLAVNFLFRTGSVRLATTSEVSSSGYSMWLEQIASEAVASKACLQITGHTSPTGTAALNDSLSLLRAEYIQSRLEEDQPGLKKRTVAAGAGSRESIIGTGRDDASDMLDRRVSFKPIQDCP